MQIWLNMDGNTVEKFIITTRNTTTNFLHLLVNAYVVNLNYKLEVNDSHQIGKFFREK